jgi:hypothetical protein
MPETSSDTGPSEQDLSKITEVPVSRGRIDPGDWPPVEPNKRLHWIMHDQRNPLETLLRHTEILEQKPSPDTVRDIVPKVKRNIKRAAQVIANAVYELPEERPVQDAHSIVSDFLCEERPDMKQDLRRFDWDVVLEPLQMDIAGRMISLSANALEGDVLPTLINNAVYAGAKKVTIRFLPYSDKGLDALAIEIVDDGCGMSQDIVDRLVAGERYSSGETMRPGDSEKQHGHGFQSAVQAVLEWGASVEIESTEAKNGQRGKTVIRIIFNGAKSCKKTDDSGSLDVITQPSLPIKLPDIQSVVQEQDFANLILPNSSTERVGNMISHSRRTVLIALSVAVASALVGDQIIRRRSSLHLQKGIISLPKQSDPADTKDIKNTIEQLEHRLSRIQYDENGRIVFIEGDGWTYERGMKEVAHLRVVELEGRDGHVLTFEPIDQKKRHVPKIALCSVPGRAFIFVEAGRISGFSVSTGEVGREREIKPDVLMPFTDAVFSQKGLRAGKLEMFSREALGEQNELLDVLIRSLERRNPDPTQIFAHTFVNKLSRSMYMRDARMANDLEVESLDELHTAIQQKEPFFAVIPPAVRREMRERRVTKDMMKNARGPGMYLCFESTDDAEAHTYVDTSI